MFGLAYEVFLELLKHVYALLRMSICWAGLLLLSQAHPTPRAHTHTHAGVMLVPNILVPNTRCRSKLSWWTSGRFWSP